MIRLLLLSIFAFHFQAQYAQHETHQIDFEHFTESRGDSDTDLILELPRSVLAMGHTPLNSTSGLGKTFNYNGNVVVVDYIDVLNDGSVQVVLRREDGKDFYGYKSTIKAILKSSINEKGNF